jgi:capsular polysaccharide biosynthesis protein
MFSDVVAFFRRNLRLIAATSLGMAVVTAVVVLLILPRTYEASVTLVIVPPKFSSELKPQTLTIQSYQKILESDAVLAETRRRLAEKGYFPKPKRFKIGEDLETRIFVSRRAEELTLAPILQAVAQSETAEQAAAIANTWAEVFLARTRDLVVGSTSPTVQFIDAQYPKAREKTAALEDQRVLTANAFQRRYDDATTSWDARISALKNETADMVAVYRSETRRLTEEFRSTRNLETRKLQLDAIRKAYSELQSGQAQVSAQLQEKQLQLDATRRQFNAIPQFITLQKAITDDALWRLVANGEDKQPDWKALQGHSLMTEELNPVHTELARRLSQLESDVNALTPRAAQLAERLAEISKETSNMDVSVSADEAGLEQLNQERDAGLARLREDRSNRLSGLTRQRQNELDAIKREWDTKLGQLDRDIAQERELLSELAKNYNQATLARGQQDFEDVRLGAAAVVPDTQLPRLGALKTLLGLVIGGLLGTGAALVREASRVGVGTRLAAVN